MDKTIEFVQHTTKDKPFFLYYASYAVHAPIQKVDSLMYKFTGKPEDDGQKNAAYATMVNNEDRNIGRLLKAISDKGLMDNTLIIFTSDNGGLNPITYQHPLRAGKGSYYEGGIRIPLVFVWKGKIKAGSKSDLPVTQLDFYPTILRSAGITKYPAVDGDNILPYLKDQTKSENLVNRPIFWYFPIYLEGGNNETSDKLFRTRPGEVVRKGDWKLHRYFEDGHLELYNLKEDIGEKKNLVNSNPGKTKELLSALDAWVIKAKVPRVTELNKNYQPK